jgi:hypothetical protein
LDRSYEKSKKYYIDSKRKETSYIQQKRRKANCIGHVFRRNWLLKHVIEGRIEMTRRRGRRRKQLLGDLKEKRGYRKLKQEALDRNLWRTRFGRRYGPVVRQTAE